MTRIFSSIPRPMKPMAGSYSWDQIEEALHQGEWVCEEKLDGIRARKFDDRLFTVSGRLIPNVRVQRNFADLPDGVDGELILPTTMAGKPKLCYTNSAVMGQGNDGDMLRFHLFDNFLTPRLPYRERKNWADNIVAEADRCNVQPVHSTPVTSFRQLQEVLAPIYERQKCEGFVLKELNSLYIYGRATKRNPAIIRFKFWEDFEATVIGFEEQMSNFNEAEDDGYGRTKRSKYSGNLEPAGCLGNLLYRTDDGTVGSVGTGFTAAQRKIIWEHQSAYKGKLVTIKRQRFGAKDKPRHTVFKCFRDERDLEPKNDQAILDL